MNMAKLLICIDMQNDFIDGVFKNEDAKAAIPNIIKLIRDHDGEIVATHDTHFNKLEVDTDWPPAGYAVVYEDTLEGKAGVPMHCHKLTDGYTIESNILAAMQEKNSNGKIKFHGIDKYSYGWCDWKETLAGYEFDEIILAGFYTDQAVLANAAILRSAYPEMKISVKADCCAGTSREAQESVLKVLEGLGMTILRP